jgi:hypothetical protein
MLTTETWEMVRMTTPAPQPSREYSLLALYSTPDKLVLEHPDRADEVERYLPGTTGLGQRGWSTQIETMVARLSRNPSTAELPDADSALNMLMTPRQAFGGVQEPLFTPSQHVRFTYITAVLAQLGLPDQSDSTRELLNRALSLAAPDQAPDEEIGEQLRSNFTAHFHNHDDYTSALDAADPGLVSDVLKRMGPPCTGVVGQSGSELCVILHSVIKSRPGAVDFDEVKEIADPINWPNHNKFFCQMDPLKPGQGCSRVLEHISTDCEQYHLKTAIKYVKGVTDDGSAVYLNYDLDDNRTQTGDNLLVVVDSGTVYISKTPDGAVQVESTKHVQIEGFSVTATAMWACVNGWNEHGEVMFFGSAQDAQSDVSLETDGTSIPPTTGAGTVVPVPTLPPGVRQEIVEESVAMLTNCLKDATETTSKYASRWLAGELRPDDFIRYYGDISARWASEPWRFLARVMGSAGMTPPPTPPPSNQQGGGTP